MTTAATFMTKNHGESLEELSRQKIANAPNLWFIALMAAACIYAVFYGWAEARNPGVYRFLTDALRPLADSASEWLPRLRQHAESLRWHYYHERVEFVAHIYTVVWLFAALEILVFIAYAKTLARNAVVSISKKIVAHGFKKSGRVFYFAWIFVAMAIYWAMGGPEIEYRGGQVGWDRIMQIQRTNFAAFWEAFMVSGLVFLSACGIFAYTVGLPFFLKKAKENAVAGR